MLYIFGKRLIKSEWETNKHLRAFVVVPKVNALEWILTHGTDARVGGGAVTGQVTSHGGLAPLRAIHSRGQRQVVAVQSDVVNASCNRIVRTE